MMSAPSHKIAGASSNPNPRRPCHFGSMAALAILIRRTRTRREAHRALRIEAEHHLFLRPQIREPAGLRQRDAELAARAFLLEEDGRVRAVEQKTLDVAPMRGLAGRKIRFGAPEACCFRPNEAFHRIA